MRVLSISTTGNTAKTTNNKNIFAPLLNAQRIDIEDRNAVDGKADITVISSKTRTLIADLNIIDEYTNLAIDVGSSASEQVIKEFGILDYARGLIDFWVIPTIPSIKQCEDSITTMSELLAIGVPPEKIIFMFTIVMNADTFERDTPLIRDIALELPVHVVDVSIPFSDIYATLKGKQTTIFDMAATEMDVKAEMKALTKAGDFEGLKKLGTRINDRGVAQQAVKHAIAFFEATPIHAALIAQNERQAKEEAEDAMQA
jgi:hypothetical protein